MPHVSTRFIQFGERQKRIRRADLQPRRLHVVADSLVVPPLRLPRLSPAQVRRHGVGAQGHGPAIGLDGRVGVPGRERLIAFRHQDPELLAAVQLLDGEGRGDRQADQACYRHGEFHPANLNEKNVTEQIG